jgi:hypothetical protein
MAFVGYVVEIIVVVLLFLGTIGAARDTLAKAPKGFAGAETGLATLALQVFQQFLKSPKWLILLILGALFVVAGDRMATGAWFFNR